MTSVLQTKFLTAVYLATGGAVVYVTGVFLFSEDTRSGMGYVLEDQVRVVPNWLSDPKYGLWHVLEFAGALGAIFFMVSARLIKLQVYCPVYFPTIL